MRSVNWHNTKVTITQIYIRLAYINKYFHNKFIHRRITKVLYKYISNYGIESTRLPFNACKFMRRISQLLRESFTSDEQRSYVFHQVLLPCRTPWKLIRYEESTMRCMESDHNNCDDRVKFFYTREDSPIVMTSRSSRLWPYGWYVWCGAGGCGCGLGGICVVAIGYGGAAFG